MCLSLQLSLPHHTPSIHRHPEGDPAWASTPNLPRNYPNCSGEEGKCLLDYRTLVWASRRQWQCFCDTPLGAALVWAGWLTACCSWWRLPAHALPTALKLPRRGRPQHSLVSSGMSSQSASLQVHPHKCGPCTNTWAQDKLQARRESHRGFQSPSL